MAWPLRVSTLFGILALTLWGCLLSAGVVMYVRYSDSRQLALLIAQRLAAETNRAWNIDRANVDFFPEPHVRLRNVTMQHAGVRLDAPEVTVSLDWSSLLHLSFVPGHVVLDNPVLTARRQLRSDDALQLVFLREFADFLPASIPWSLQGMRLTVQHGHIILHHAAFGAVMRDLNASARLPGLFAGSLELEGMLSLPGICDRMELRLHLAASGANAPLTGRLDLEGDLTAAPSVPLRLHLPFVLHKTLEMHLQGMQLDLDTDTATFNATLALKTGMDMLLAALGSESLPHDSKQPILKGTAYVRHLSLPRWFEFARKLPPGIEAALNNVSGELDFVLAPDNLAIPRLQAAVCGIPVVGAASVSNFAKPGIHLAVQTDEADINAILPELLRKGPQAINWPGPAPVRQNDSRAWPDYDIQVTATKAQIWKFAAARFIFRCTPRPKGSRLDIESRNFYDGSFAATVDIEDQVTIAASLNRVMLDHSVALVSGGDPVLGGRLTGKAALQGSRRSVDHFLASLNGTMHGQIEQGWLSRGNDREKNFFKTMDFAFKATGPGLVQQPLPPLLLFTGDWNIGLRAADWEGSCALSGALGLDSASLMVKRVLNAPGRIQWSGDGLAINLEAQFDFDEAKDILHIRNASGKMNGGTFSGSFSSSSSSKSPFTRWQGSLHATTTALRSILQQRNMVPPDMPEGALQYLDVRGDFDVAGQELKVRNLSGRLDDTTFSGNIQYTPDEIYTWQTDLALGTLSLGRYMPQHASRPAHNLLDGLSARGMISVDSLIIAKLVQRSVRVPFVLENRSLVCRPITFIPYKGRGEAELHMEASSAGYRTRLRYAANNVDAALFSQEAGFSTILGGIAALNADVTGVLQQRTDIPAALDGNWSVTATQGYIAHKGSGGSVDKPIPFRSISASGVMQRGTLHTRNISLKGNELAASGNASIHLADWTLNCRLNVSTRNFSNVPVTYTGSLDAPDRSINPLNAMAGAIGKLGNGLYGLVEDVLSSPFRLLR